MWYSDLSTRYRVESVSVCYNPIIQLHQYGKDLLLYSPNEWNIMSGRQQLTRLIQLAILRCNHCSPGFTGSPEVTLPVLNPSLTLWDTQETSGIAIGYMLIGHFMSVSSFWAGVWSKLVSLDFGWFPPAGFSSHHITRTRRDLERLRSQVIKSSEAKTQHGTAARWEKEKYLKKVNAFLKRYDALILGFIACRAPKGTNYTTHVTVCVNF